MHEDLLLAIDQGTSSTKVMIFDLEGHVIAASYSDTRVRYPRLNWMESYADDWWGSIVAGIREVLLQPSVDPEQIRGIGLCGFMHTLVPVDPNGRALYPAILWADQRCDAEVRELAQHSELVARVTGRSLSTMSWIPRLLWLQKHAPEVLANAHMYLSTKDALRHRLTGEFATDLHDADGVGLTDLATGDWSSELLCLVGIPLQCMPPIHRCDEIAGTVTQAAARETGLIAGTPVVTGTGDWMSTLIGSGCFLPERTCFYLGSAGILGSFDSAEELDCLGRTHYFGSVTSTGSAFRWVSELFNEDRTGTAICDSYTAYARMCAEAGSSEPGAKELLFLPHLMGERGGGMRPHARGAIFGLSLAHRRCDIIRAVLEGTVLWLRATTEPYMDHQVLGDFLAFGGGVQSSLWRQICASVFKRKLLVPEVREGGALGAAMLAAVGTGLRGSYSELAAKWTRIAVVEEPKGELMDLYDGIYRRFRHLEAVLSSLNQTKTGA